MSFFGKDFFFYFAHKRSENIPTAQFWSFKIRPELHKTSRSTNFEGSKFVKWLIGLYVQNMETPFAFLTQSEAAIPTKSFTISRSSISVDQRTLCTSSKKSIDKFRVCKTVTVSVGFATILAISVAY